MQRLAFAFGGAALTTLVVLLVNDRKSALAAAGIGLAVWMMLGALTDLAVKAGVGKAGFATAMRRLAGLPRSLFGTTLAHFGIGMTVLGIVCVVSFGTESIATLKKGDTIDVGGRELRFEGLRPISGANFTAQVGTFILPDGTTVESSKRFYPVRQMPTTEAGIKTLIFSQIYVQLGDETSDGAVVVHAWWKPLVTLIWLGGLVMMVGAAVSLSDRRLRVGAPAARQRRLVGAGSAGA
jgi:cytochrome c-type biogenesis protein CcmF